MRQKASQTKIDFARRLFDEGKTYEEIGQVMGYSPEWVRQLLMRSPEFEPRPAHKRSGKDEEQEKNLDSVAA
jgi:hypothetical protein